MIRATFFFKKRLRHIKVMTKIPYIKTRPLPGRNSDPEDALYELLNPLQLSESFKG